jgi:thioredoxin 1
MLAPVLEEIAAEQAGKLRVAKLNVDNSPHTAQQFGVLSIPTLIVFRGGQERGRAIGAQGKDSIVRTLLGDAAA